MKIKKFRIPSIRSYFVTGEITLLFIVSIDKNLKFSLKKFIVFYIDEIHYMWRIINVPINRTGIIFFKNLCYLGKNDHF